MSHRILQGDLVSCKRRRVLLLAALAWTVAGRTGVLHAQAKKAPPVIGWLSSNTRERDARLLGIFKEALASLGWKEASQFTIDARWADGQIARLAVLAKELADSRPALIVTSSGQVTAAAAKAAPQIPVVQATGTDLIAAGFAASLARPGGMVTGLTNVQVDLTEKFLELLLATAPKVRRVGVLADTNNPNHALNMKAVARSATQYAVDARVAEVTRNDEIEPAILRLSKEGVQALIVLSSPLLTFERPRILKLALAQRWPVISGGRTWTDGGALLSYGVHVDGNYRRAAYYVDRILKGAKPADLPIEQPTKFELVVNLKTAKALGVAIPQSILLQASQVIE